MENINLDLNISYETDEEYQNSLKQVYNIDMKEEDENTIFENMTNGINILSKELKDVKEVIDLCNLTAKMMLSEDLEIGLFILHSYDYFKLFYPLYCEYLKKHHINMEIYEKLLEKIK